MTKQEYQKENFVQFLASLTPEEVNKLIEQNGKRPKLTEPIAFLDEKSK